ncbi:MAG TPA: FAD-dependent oxidoreductase, partial [Chloroflexi bacterium]|nr:FAD-dependent oxidoreductase [Chloroflexota bacterium]
LTRLPMTSHELQQWEIEPFRFAGVRAVQRGFARIDEKAERTGVAPDGRSLAELLARH